MLLGFCLVDEYNIMRNFKLEGKWYIVSNFLVNKHLKVQHIMYSDPFTLILQNKSKSNLQKSRNNYIKSTCG